MLTKLIPVAVVVVMVIAFFYLDVRPSRLLRPKIEQLLYDFEELTSLQLRVRLGVPELEHLFRALERLAKQGRIHRHEIPGRDMFWTLSKDRRKEIRLIRAKQFNRQGKSL
ncbi:hypothetical protein FJZ48_04105 [Candidatus Uhrbacteria bacterium]|nr:hypothetical protein [Candidatus Uhrbacteria bacterium]